MRGADGLEQEKTSADKVSLVSRHNRVKRIKATIIVLIIVFLLLPTILCIIMFFKMRSLQKQIDVLMIERYGVTYHELFEKNNESIAHAAVVKYNNSIGTDNALDKNDESQTGDNNTEDETVNTETKKPDIENPEKRVHNTDLSEPESFSGETEETSDESKDISDEWKESSDEWKDITDESQESEESLESAPVTEKKAEKEDLDLSKEGYTFESSKTVYLTFDDGPSKYTSDILDMLDTYNVKATFFVIGKTDKHSKEMYKRIIDDGHSLGIHSYSHVYDKVYNSLEDFEKDFTKLSDLLYDTTGYIPSLYRFPGGSGNSVSKVDIHELIRFLKEKSVVYFDWNVVNGDATGIDYSPEELYSNVMEGIKIHNTSIVLMHDTDTKENTIKSLESILKTLTEQDVNILPLTDDVTPIRQVK
ncbi:polysaccharide deacetylase [Anaerocolumna aminovalerica]|jgi:peptidoglycan/xylan/chitin deacetylase (PgdA/CDA1 family)|uniref:polysaccharide deacetylase family protein n=1 Tax=Anaerocolumna aminovalerica TaxID=1527 RepID=UPI001C0EA029|nr:polysaccharide deacetylase family protein [Anaerocolumna aminovalerica]MBU5331556.1 polysaccharide deacetylase [Anaerocolumna aminovalerica]